MELVEWLEKQIQVDEMWAREASQHEIQGARMLTHGAHWTWVEGEDWEPVEVDPTDPDWTAEGLCSVEQFPSGAVRTRHGIKHELPVRYLYAEDPVPVVAGHIVNWEPARVLLACRAKRLIITECMLELKDREGGLEGRIGTTAWYVLTAMALEYLERPGFREDWTVGER